MVFSSLLFLFLFLPAVLILSFLVPRRLRHLILLIVSLFFYAWGEPSYVFLMIGTISLDYIFGIFIERFQRKEQKRTAGIVLRIAVGFNIGFLGLFKYTDLSLIHIYNAAQEPEIIDLANYLISRGAKIKDAGKSTVIVEGVSKLNPTEYTVMPDRIVATTYLCGAAAVSYTHLCKYQLIEF